jgi:predicted NAD/FAD-binding protein
MSQRIAVVGAGIAGLASAWWLSQRHRVTLFEANDYLGGHTHTHEVEVAGRRLAIDTGFIVFNPEHYPLLTALFDQLGVASHPTTMSFSVHDARNGLEYNANSLDTLFCQRRNLVSPRFWRMLLDLRRFYREAPALLRDDGEGPSLGEYLARGGYSRLFIEDHLVPMASALWSSPSAQVMDFPARYMLQFMANHQMLQLSGRPSWRVVSGGSARYVDALRARWTVTERIGCPVRAVRREQARVVLDSAAGSEAFDHVVLACHSDQALALLGDADTAEREVLGAIRYQSNEAVLHTDARLLPRDRKAWAAWNAHVPVEPGAPCTVSYCMNLLQGIDCDEALMVTLNRSEAIDPTRVLRRMRYAHPIHDHAMVRAQARRDEIQGQRRTWFAGAYWGWGFHEDGIRSAHTLVQRLQSMLDRTADPVSVAA